MKKFALPKIRFGVKKNTKGDPLWNISTKVAGPRAEKIMKSRKNKFSWIKPIRRGIGWIRTYFKTVGWIFFVGFGSFLFLAIFSTPTFRLNPDRIEVILRPEPVFDRNAITSILHDFSGKNVFSISTKEIFESLSENIRHIASVEKTLLLTDGIRVTVTSFPPLYRAFIGEEVFLLTGNGQLIPNIAEVEVPALEIHHLVSDPNLGKNTPIMIEDMMTIKSIIENWRRLLPKYPISALRFYDQEKEIHISSGNTRYIFSLLHGEEQIQILEKFLVQDVLRADRQAYFDLRIPKKVYTCAQDEVACQQNISQIYEQ